MAVDEAQDLLTINALVQTVRTYLHTYLGEGMYLESTALDEMYFQLTGRARHLATAFPRVADGLDTVLDHVPTLLHQADLMHVWDEIWTGGYLGLAFADLQQAIKVERMRIGDPEQPRMGEGDRSLLRSAAELEARFRRERYRYLPPHLRGLLPFGDAEADFLVGEDFKSCVWRGREFTFSPMQGAAVRYLYEKQWNAGVPEVHGAALLEEIESKSKRLGYLFKRSPAWGTLIVPGKKKGSYRLNLPPKRTYREFF